MPAAGAGADLCLAQTSRQSDMQMCQTRTKASKCADEEERKVDLLLEAGLRADRHAEPKVLLSDRKSAASFARRLAAAHRGAAHVHVSRMPTFSVLTLRLGLKTNFIPRMEFVAMHACALRPSCHMQRLRDTSSRVAVMQGAIHVDWDPVAAGLRCGQHEQSTCSTSI